MKTDFTKTYFQEAWGDGYYDNFSFGVGIDRVFKTCIFPFIKQGKTVLEIGPGGGIFTERVQGKTNLVAIDVIKKPERFNQFTNFQYYELPNKSFGCDPIESESIDFCYSCNVFCHLSNKAISEYLKSVNRVLKPGGDFVFIISNFKYAKNHVDNPDEYSLGDRLTMGHFYQDERTLDLVIGEGWDIVSRNMIPEHRDIIIHLNKSNVLAII